MLYKHAIRTAVLVWVLILGIASGVAAYRDDLSLKSWVEYTWFVSIACSIIGFALRAGAEAGPNIAGYEAVAHTAMDREKHIEADNDDARAGMAFGTVVMFSSLAVFATALTTLTCID